MRKKFLSVLLSVCMVLTMTSSWAFAQEAPVSESGAEISEKVMVEEEVAVVPDADSLPDSEELFAGYAEQVLYGDLMGDSAFYAARNPARNNLDEPSKKVYDYLKTQIETVAANGGSTEFTIPVSVFGLASDSVELTASDLNVSTLFIVNGESLTLTQEAKTALDNYRKTYTYDGAAVVEALLVDLPYDLYWFNKTTTYSYGQVLGDARYSRGSDGSEKITLSGSGSITMKVSTAYQGGNDTTVAAVAQRVTDAKRNAQAIVANYTGSNTVYDRLVYYKDTIRSLVDYDTAAASDDSTPYGDPWQLINVFDHTTSDAKKAVVCEGYSKAFQYLCDLTLANSLFEAKSVDCYIVTGYIGGEGVSGGAGPHMWNIVRIDGKSYLVDVTNCNDNASSIDSDLFLRGGMTSSREELIVLRFTDGTSTQEYPVFCNYEFTVGGSTVHFGYDVDTPQSTAQNKVWGTDVVTLATTNYTPDEPQKLVPSANDFTYTTKTAVYTGAENKPAITSDKHDGNFTVTYNPATVVDAGEYTITVDVAAHDDYAAAASIPLGTWTITPAPATITAANATVTVGQTVSLNASTNPPDLALTYTSETPSVATVSASGAVTGVTAGTAQIEIALDSSVKNYTADPKTVTVTVTEAPAPDTTAIVTLTAHAPITYSGSPVNLGAQFDVSVTDKDGDELDSAKITYTYDGQTYTGLGYLPAVEDAGDYTVTASYNDGTRSGKASATFTINKAQQADLTITSTSGTFGEPLTLAVEGGSGDGAVTYEVVSGAATIAGNILTPGAAGTVTVKATKAASTNYEAKTVTADITIAKAAAPAAISAEKLHTYTAEGPQTLDLSTLPAFTALNVGTITGGSVDTVTNDDGILTGTPSVSGSTLTYTLAGQDAYTAGLTATISVTISTQNYRDFTLTLTVKLTEKGTQEAPACVLTFVLNDDEETYTAVIEKVAGAEYSFDGTTWSSSNTLAGVQPKDTVTAYIRMAETDELMASDAASTTGTAPLLAVKAPTAQPNGGLFEGSQKVTLTSATPDAEIYYTLDGSTPTAEDGTLYEEPFTLTETTTVKAVAVKADMADSAVVTFTFTRYTEPDYPYYPSYPSYPSNPGGGSTTPTPAPDKDKDKDDAKPDDTGKEEQEPGTSSEVTSTPASVIAAPAVTVSGGTATATVPESMGQELVEQAGNRDTVVIAPEVSASVSSTQVNIPASTVAGIGSQSSADLRIETPAANVTVPNGALSSLASGGGSVAVTTSVSNGVVNLTISANSKPVEKVDGGLKVTVPQPGCTSGTVAMLVKADGSTEIIRQSIADPASGTVSVTLDGSARLTFVDNSKTFTDVASTDWSANAVAFASSHELMNGSGDGAFTPNAPMTRGMLAVVLYNLASNPAVSGSASFGDVSASDWYANAVQWAASSQIVTGYTDGTFKPDAVISREQLAVMLYRYAGSPAVSSTYLPFSDAGSVSSFASQAMAWAVENHILSGKGNGMMDPQSGATRAEVAQMMMNFVSSQAK